MKKIIFLAILIVISGCQVKHAGRVSYVNNNGKWTVHSVEFDVQYVDKETLEYLDEYMNNLPERK